MFKYLIIDPGNWETEQNNPGMFYVALSRAKSMGTFDSDTDTPIDSNVYWTGSNVSADRICYGATKKRKRRNGQRETCMRIEKRNSWVEYLNEKQRGTETVVYSVDDKERMANTTFTQEEVEKRIMNII